jgi:hypothetical protein
MAVALCPPLFSRAFASSIMFEAIQSLPAVQGSDVTPAPIPAADQPDPAPVGPELVLPQVVPKPTPRPDRTTEAAACTDCRKAAPDNSKLGIYRRVIARVGGQVLYGRTRGKPISRACTRIIDGRGNVGDLGRELAGTMLDYYPQYYLDGNSLAEVCPRFGRLSNDDKVKAWLWFWMVLANDESSCEPNTYHRNSLVPGWGLFAAELSPAYRRQRGMMCRGNIKASSTQIHCAVSTMVNIQLSRGLGVLDRGSYWEGSRRPGRSISPNMHLFGKCFRG